MKNIVIKDVRVLPGDSGFLLDDGETSILYDTGFAFTGKKLAQNVKEYLGDRQLDFIFLTHSHYDHALGSVYVKKLYPNAKIVAGSYAAKIFKKDSAKKLMGELDKKFAIKNGINDYEDFIDLLCVDVEVNDGDKLICGDMNFTVVELPGHTKCSVGFYLQEEELLLGSETLGVYIGNEKIIPSYLVGYKLTLDSFEKAQQLKIKNILVPHYGLLSKNETSLYLMNGKKNAIETARDICNGLKNGLSKEQLLNQFKEKYYTDSVKEIYPIDAMTLNTNIMIDLIEKEMPY